MEKLVAPEVPPTAESTAPAIEIGPTDLLPRLKDNGYDTERVGRRRAWVEKKTGSQLPHIGGESWDFELTRGNIENPIGVAQVPMGVAGPVLIHGQNAKGLFYVPMATTEGALHVAAHRMRKRYRELLREEIAQTVSDPALVDEEMRELLDCL